MKSSNTHDENNIKLFSKRSATKQHKWLEKIPFLRKLFENVHDADDQDKNS